MNHNILLHYLLHQYVPNINSYEHFLKSKTEFIFNPNVINSVDFINSHFVNSFLQKNKFQALHELSNNGFITAEKKKTLTHFFCFSQRTYHKLKKLYQIYRQKKYTIYDNDNDLCLSPLSNYKNNIQIIQQNTIYSFKINDLIRLIVEGLTYTYGLFLEPKEAKNPYNNIAFEYHNLNNIYFHILFRTNIHVPFLIHAYFKADFCISKLVYNQEAYLKDLAIKNFFNNNDDDDEAIIEHITNMTESYKTHLYVHTEFPIHKLIEKLKPCLLDYLYADFSYHPSKRRKYKKILINKLKKIKNDDPSFGRVFIRMNRNSLINRNGRINNLMNEMNNNTNYDMDNFINNINNDNNEHDVSLFNGGYTTPPPVSPPDTPPPLIRNEDLSDNTSSNVDTEDVSMDVVDMYDNDTIINENNTINNLWSERYNNLLQSNNTLQTHMNDSRNNINEILDITSNFINNYHNDLSLNNIDINDFYNDTPVENNPTIPNLVRSTSLSSLSIQINSVQNLPYDAYTDPFNSPSSSIQSINSPSIRTQGLEILNNHEFNINMQNINEEKEESEESEESEETIGG